MKGSPCVQVSSGPAFIHIVLHVILYPCIMLPATGDMRGYTLYERGRKLQQGYTLQQGGGFKTDEGVVIWGGGVISPVCEATQN